MKKFLTFIVLFGVALLVLRFFEADSEPTGIENSPLDSTEARGEASDEPSQAGPDGGSGGEPSEEAAQVEETTPEQSDDSGASSEGEQESEQSRVEGLSINGPFEGRLFDGKPGRAVRSLVLFIQGEDSRTDAIAIGAPDSTPTLRDVLLASTVNLFEIGLPDKAQATLTSKETIFERKPPTEDESSGFDIETNWVRKADFVGMYAQLFTGAPFVPLNFQAQTATLDARNSQERTLFAPGPIDVNSEELRAEGTDLTVDLDQDSFNFASAAEVEFERAPGEQVTLLSEGRLVVRRIAAVGPEAQNQVQIEAHDGARLILTVKDGSLLTANTISARGREEADGFLLTRLDAMGDVVWTSGQSEARGDRARLRFDAKGQLDDWSLEGDPSLRFLLEQLQGLPAEDVPSHGSVRITGQGPLAGKSGDVRSFEMEGPALIEVTEGESSAVPSTSLRAVGQVSGRIDGETSSLNASGGVLLEAPDGRLEAQALQIKLSRDSEQRNLLAITTIGGAKLISESGKDSVLTLVSAGRLSATRQGSLWHVDEGDRVSLSIEPKDLEAHPEKVDQVFRAQAGKVTSFDPASATLEAEDGVQVFGVQGTGRGDSIVIHNKNRIELKGTKEQPATFEGPEGFAQALFILRENDHSEARGNVLTRFVRVGGTRFPTQDYEIRCEELIADQRRETLPDGGEVRHFDLDATGSVDGRVGFGEESSTIQCARLVGKRFERWSKDSDGTLVPRNITTNLSASGHTKSNLTLQDSQVELTALTFDLARSETIGSPADGALGVEASKDALHVLAEARGAVNFDLFTVRAASPIHLVGSGDSLNIDESLTGSLSPLPGERVHLTGSLPGQETPYVLDAEQIEFQGGAALDALNPVITVGQKDAQATSVSRFVAQASHLSANENSMLLEQNVSLKTWTATGVPWSLTADELEIQGGVNTGGSGPQLEDLRADGGVEILLGLRGSMDVQDVVASAKAERITGSSIEGTIRLEGSPDGTPASVITPALITHAEWVEVDPEIQLIRRSGPGTMLPSQETRPGVPDWELSYSSAYSFEDHETDSFLFVIDQPNFSSRYLEGLLRGTVAMFWFDKVGWQDLPEKIRDSQGPYSSLREEPSDRGAPPSGVPIARLLELLEGRNLDGVLKEAYFEGPIEILQEDALVAHAEAIYADCEAGNALLVRPQFNLYGKDLGESFEKLTVRSKWIRQTSDGVLQANDATITTSPFAKPSLVVETGDLRIVPADRQRNQTYQVYLRENRIRFGEDGLRLPLPPIAFGTDKEYQPIWPTARFGNSARFGTLLTLGFRRPLPKIFSAPVHDAFGGDEQDPYDANFSVDASWLSGRGGLLDLGVDIEAADKYELETLLGIVPDNNSDEGYIRVAEDDRDNPRLWFRAHSRFDIDPKEWVDVEASLQSDAGIQSEFWENEFEHYERDESYVQWRKASGETYYQATAKKQLEVFRSTIEELPSAGAFFGRRPILKLGQSNLIWDGRVNASYLRRRAGEAGVQSPFSTTPVLDATNDEFADGFGDREVLRFDTQQRLEVPVSLGNTGLRATPFVDTRFTAWDEGQNTAATPTRFLASVGLRLATQIWRANANGTFNQLAPFVEVANSASENAVGSPVVFDTQDTPYGGDRVDLGLRGRFAVEEGTSLLDFEVRTRNQRNVPSELTPGWQPLSVFARVDLNTLGAPIQLWHDGRYDLSNGSTRYALTAVGYRANRKLGVEVGHRYGVSPAGERLFEAGVLSGQYRWTEKWELEARQVFSLIGGSGLDTQLTLRRYGTDLVFELEFKVRQGEGTTFGFSFRPRFGFRPSRIGVINY